MQGPVRIRRAQADEAGQLSAIAVESKAYWGYSPEFLQACRDELLIPATQLKSGKFTYCVAESEGKPDGFYGLERLSPVEYELHALFVRPAKIGTGVGRMLMEHAKQAVTTAGGSRIIIQADPHAEAFYRAAGGKSAGHRESGSVPGRLLPVFIVDLESMA